MKRFPQHTIIVLSGLLFAGAARAEGPFLTLSFPEASKKAEAEKKLLFLDFYATWCGPCKVMDRTTFKDPKVVEFLKTKVVALAIDGDKEGALAQKFRIGGYPTLIFAKPDGTVVEQTVGALQTDEFLRMSEQAVSGKDSLTRLTEAHKNAPEDVVIRMQLAEALSTRSRNKEAVEYLMRILEGPGVTPVGVSIMPMAVYQLYNLSGDESGSEKTVQKLYDAAAKAIADRTATDAQLALYDAVNKVNSEPGKTLAAYDELRGKGGDDRFLERATRTWHSALIEAKRYEDVAKGVNVPAVVKQLFSGVPSGSATTAPAAQGPAADAAEIARRQLIMQSLAYYEALVALQRKDEAAEVAKEALRVDESGDMYAALAWTGLSTGKPSEANLAQARKASELAGGKDVGVIDMLARILHALGQKDEAVKLVKEAQQWAQPGFESDALAECLRAIGV